jgi:cation diffusion facilitator CzcD-associated flavoprotein CzcO
MAETADVVVIGAGPAGLAVGACLRKADLNFIILEKERQVGSSWRRHYERLHLHTIKQYSSLPFLPFPKDYPRYVPRNLMIKYLDTYAENFSLKPRFGEAVRSVRRDGTDWYVESASSSVRSRYVVVASGYNAEPVSPPFPKLEKFKGKVIHSADYVNAKAFAGQSVLVIGMGNTGAEIALDLAEGGARATISLRNGVHIVPRDLFGLPIQMVAMLATKLLPQGTNDVLFPLILDFVLGDLSKFGIRRPQQGILQQIRSSAKIPVIDVGTVRKISESAIRMAPGISEIAEDGVYFNGGDKEQFDAIILATGYRSNYASFLQMDDMQSGNAGVSNGKTGYSGIYFVGFRNSVTGLLREIGKEAVQVADDISRQRTRL